MNARELLIDTVAHLSPPRALEGVSAEAAERRMPGANHSIAELVAHMNFWAAWFCGRCEGAPEPMVEHAALGWPAVTPHSWPEIQRQFVATLDRAVALGDNPGRLESPLTPPIDFPPLAHYTVRDALVHIAAHNGHHLGQVILLRQMMGLWPPPAGSWTW